MGDEKSRDLRERTKAFASRMIRLYAALPKTPEAQVIGPQLLRSGTSVGTNYREAGRARSPAEFAAKLGITLQEADETAYWLELLTEAKMVPQAPVADLMQEAHELIAIFVTSLETAKNGRSQNCSDFCLLTSELGRGDFEGQKPH